MHGWLTRRRQADERGAVMVEAVIILPLLMLLTFGAIELGIGFNQKAALESISRAGARTGAIHTDDADVPPLGGPQYAIGENTLGAINAALSSTAVPELNRVYVYRVKSDGSGYGPASWGAACGSQDCMYFDYDPNTKQFVDPAQGPGWPKGDRDGCTVNADRVAVRLEGTFHFLTGLIGTGVIHLTATSVLQLEPTANC